MTQRNMFVLGILAGFCVTSFDVFPFLVGFGIGMGCYEINPEAVVKTRDYAIRHLSEGFSAATSSLQGLGAVRKAPVAEGAAEIIDT